MKQGRFSIRKRLRSFLYAFNGLRVLFVEEHNAWLHLAATIVVTAAGVFFQLNTYEWIAIVFSIGFVVTTEIINTALENVSDFISPEKNEKIKKIKDLSAAAVLIGALTALLTGLIIFIPKIKMIL